METHARVWNLDSEIIVLLGRYPVATGVSPWIPMKRIKSPFPGRYKCSTCSRSLSIWIPCRFWFRLVAKAISPFTGLKIIYLFPRAHARGYNISPFKGLTLKVWMSRTRKTDIFTRKAPTESVNLNRWNYLRNPLRINEFIPEGLTPRISSLLVPTIVLSDLAN